MRTYQYYVWSRRFVQILRLQGYYRPFRWHPILYYALYYTVHQVQIILSHITWYFKRTALDWTMGLWCYSISDLLINQHFLTLFTFNHEKGLSYVYFGRFYLLKLISQPISWIFKRQKKINYLAAFIKEFTKFWYWEWFQIP